MKENIVLNKSKDFAKEIIFINKILILQKEFVISKQLLRSGTSIGANLEESVGAYSDKEFPVKLGIAYKEARETKYWLELIKDSYKINDIQLTINHCEEIIKLLGKSLSTIRKKNKLLSKY
jgi:four helix bundle protein